MDAMKVPNSKERKSEKVFDVVLESEPAPVSLSPPSLKDMGLWAQHSHLLDSEGRLRSIIIVITANTIISCCLPIFSFQPFFGRHPQTRFLLTSNSIITIDIFLLCGCLAIFNHGVTTSPNKGETGRSTNLGDGPDIVSKYPIKSHMFVATLAYTIRSLRVCVCVEQSYKKKSVFVLFSRPRGDWPTLSVGVWLLSRFV